eukprot:TRINITY_DN1496_c0_g1_i2.p1 TRINITY_DN1496_c0_g1~~TRINITY_DN1496_c0_g1_i2.p1  ORF type:complete len:111 (+),score=11.97 TRINITY_DN1496_c0_g1_i2:18-350(+)
MDGGIHVDNREQVQYVLSGGLAGVLGRTLMAPLSRIKILWQVDDFKKYKGFFKTAAKILRTDGWTGFYRGNFAHILRVFPEMGMRFYFYEMYKHRFCRYLCLLRNCTSLV